MIIRNISNTRDKNKIKKFLGKDNVIIMNSDDYKYIWDMGHNRNSGIKDRTYPKNYISNILQAVDEFKDYDIVIDLDEESFIEFGKTGLQFGGILNEIEDGEL